MEKIVVRGCIEETVDGEKCITVVEDNKAQFWSAYRVKEDGTSECVADFVYKKDALFFAATKMSTNQRNILIQLPDGRMLAASDKCDPDYPGIRIDLIDKDGITSIAWAEYNTGRQDYTDQQRLRVLVWNQADDEPAVNMSYDTGTFEKN